MFIKRGVADKDCLRLGLKGSTGFQQADRKADRGRRHSQGTGSAKDQLRCKKPGYWRGRKIPTPTRKTVVLFKADILLDGTKFSWGRMERRGWKMAMSIMGKGNRQVGDPGQGAITRSSLKLLHPHHILCHRVREHRCRQWSRSCDLPFSPLKQTEGDH